MHGFLVGTPVPSLENKVLHIDITTEDTRLIISRDGLFATALVPLATEEKNTPWNGIIVDAPSGKTARVAWTDKQIAAVMALALGLGEDLIEEEKGEKIPALVEALYKICDGCFAKQADGSEFPPECRMIP